MDLKNIREKIDRIDESLFELLDERMELALRAGKIKKRVHDEEREKAVLSRLQKLSRTSRLVRSGFIADLVSAIMQESRRIQETSREKPQTLNQRNSQEGNGKNRSVQKNGVQSRGERQMKIAVLGAGHMGAWIIQELQVDKHNLAIYDKDRSRTANQQGVSKLESPAELESFAPQMLINAVSLRDTIEAFDAALPFLPKDCILADLASVKGNIPDFYKENSFPFASVHPMFGPTFAHADELERENAIIIKESCSKGAAFFRELFERLRLNLFEYSFDEHDRMIAYSLTLPFASTMVFSACMNRTAVPGTTFKKHREIAQRLLAEDDFLLAEILFNPHSLKQLENVTNRLEFLKRVIEEKDFEEAKKFFNNLRANISGSTLEKSPGQ